jgi:hypothetical protein
MLFASVSSKGSTRYGTVISPNSDLHLVGAVCRLAPGSRDTEAAARYWEETFGVPRVGDQLLFTNTWIEFEKGEGGNRGLVSITIAAEGEARLNGILKRARQDGVCGNGGINTPYGRREMEFPAG